MPTVTIDSNIGPRPDPPIQWRRIVDITSTFFFRSVSRESRCATILGRVRQIPRCVSVDARENCFGFQISSRSISDTTNETSNQKKGKHKQEKRSIQTTQHDLSQMTFLNYSTPGRGRGRGSGRGRGRGRGSGRGGMSWVRGAGKNVESVHSKWVRPSEDRQTPGNSTATKMKDGEANSGKFLTTMMKKGSYQLVLPKKENHSSENVGNHSVSELSMNKEKRAYSERTGKTSEKSVLDPEEKGVMARLKKIGNHKLVLDVVENHPTVNPEVTIKKVSTTGQDATDAKMIKDTNIAPRSSEESLDLKPMTKYAYPTNARQLGSRKRPPVSDYHNKRRIPQRVRLTNPQSKAEHSMGESEEDAYGSDQANVDETKERLTDFAYCETGRTVQHHHHRSWKAKNRNSEVEQVSKDRPRKMGLVRADLSNAPICHFYAQGMECTDKFCQKRHDVPKESAVPVCYFFQRNGQCLKEDCKFRHIKINANAAICPSFTLLGYCEKKECPMKHLRPRLTGSSKPAGPGNTNSWSYTRQV